MNLLNKFLSWLKSLLSSESPAVLDPPGETTGPKQTLAEYAATFLGVLYHWGGDFKRWKDGKDYGLDCSGFEQALAEFQGIDEPGDQTADGIMQIYRKRGYKEIPFGSEQLGDRVFYGSGTVTTSGNERRLKATHIVMVVGPNKIIGAQGGGSDTTSAAIAKAKNAKIRYDRLDYRKDRICILRPTPKITDVPLSDNFSVPGFRPEWVKSGLATALDLLPKFNAAADDMDRRFFPGYKGLVPVAQAKVWLTLFGAIAARESGIDRATGFFKTSVVYRESSGDDSEGLFQLTYGDKHAPKTKADGDLHDPILNLTVALKIGADLVASNGVVAAGGYVKYGAEAPKGLAKYWSTIRTPDSKSSHHLAEIIEKTKKAKV